MVSTSSAPSDHDAFVHIKHCNAPIVSSETVNCALCALPVEYFPSSPVVMAKYELDKTSEPGGPGMQGPSGAKLSNLEKKVAS